MTAPATIQRPRRPSRPTLHLVAVENRQRFARLHLFTYIVGNALFWLLWGALSVTADRWYWWATAPVAGWTAVLVFHLVYVRRRERRRAARA